MQSVYVILILFVFCCSSFSQEVNSFTSRCKKSSPAPNSTVHFVNPRDLVSEVHGCINQFLSFSCCMADYQKVQWLQQLSNGTWVDFFYTTLYRDLGDDDNQTAILQYPTDHGVDDGNYKCIGHGMDPRDVISHTLVVKLRPCPDVKNSPPIAFLPDENITTTVVNLTANISAMSGGIFGTHCNRSVSELECTMHWVKMTEHGEEPIPAGDFNSSIRVFYVNNSTASCINDFTSSLYIFDFSESDYGTYICVMTNKLGINVRVFIFKKIDEIKNCILDHLAIAGFCAGAIILFLVAIWYPYRWDLRIRYNEFFADERGEETSHDILLLHTNSEDFDESFARYCSENLQQHHYNVRIKDDIKGGEDVINAWLEMSESSRSILVILSPDFLKDRDQKCRLPLRNIIRRRANIVFLVFQMNLKDKVSLWNPSSTVVTVDERHFKLTRDLAAAIRIKAKIHWPVEVNSYLNENKELEWERMKNDKTIEVNRFWELLLNRLHPQHMSSETHSVHNNDTDPLEPND